MKTIKQWEEKDLISMFDPDLQIDFPEEPYSTRTVHVSIRDPQDPERLITSVLEMSDHLSEEETIHLIRKTWILMDPNWWGEDFESEPTPPNYRHRMNSLIGNLDEKWYKSIVTLSQNHRQKDPNLMDGVEKYLLIGTKRIYDQVVELSKNLGIDHLVFPLRERDNGEVVVTHQEIDPEDPERPMSWSVVPQKHIDELFETLEEGKHLLDLDPKDLEVGS